MIFIDNRAGSRALRAGFAIGVSLLLGLGAVTASADEAGSPIKLGVLNDMTGAFADLGGKGSIVAAQMAIDDAGGKVLGRPVQLISADSQNKPDIAAAIARRWFDVEDVSAIIDPVPSGAALAVLDLSRERKKIVLIASSGLADMTGKSCTSTSFQWAYDTSVLAKGTAAAVVSGGAKKWFFLTADVAFGHSLANQSRSVVEANGGTVVGEVRHPYLTHDFSSFLLQAQASGAEVVALANSGSDTTNSIRQAIEFGIGSGNTKLVALLAFVTDIHSLGLDRAKGLLLTESFYWDLNDETRAWSKRFADKMGGRMPSMAQAAAYSGVAHYLKAMASAGTTEGQAVADKMRELPINDFMMKDGRARKDGRIVHDFYLFQVKAPEESKGPWDYYKLIRKIPAAEITPPDGSTGCPFDH
ncbi:MAG: ABC-type branched-chain amino acid transport system, periplasmic component [Tardiphaga sp.]|nr:ABC-type branched-chain amino acid transport system, periplasmic component [Tardiphaga sp.]